MALTSGTDKIVNKTLVLMARSSTILSWVSIFIALMALGLSVYSIRDLNTTTSENQLLYKQQLQELNEIKNILSINEKGSELTSNPEEHECSRPKAANSNETEVDEGGAQGDP